MTGVTLLLVIWHTTTLRPAVGQCATGVNGHHGENNGVGIEYSTFNYGTVGFLTLHFSHSARSPPPSSVLRMWLPCPHFPSLYSWYIRFMTQRHNDTTGGWTVWDVTSLAYPHSNCVSFPLLPINKHQVKIAMSRWIQGWLLRDNYTLLYNSAMGLFHLAIHNVESIFRRNHPWWSTGISWVEQAWWKEYWQK